MQSRLSPVSVTLLETAQQAGHRGVEAARDYLKSNDSGLSLPGLDV